MVNIPTTAGWTVQQWLSLADELLTSDSHANRYPSMKDYEEAILAYDAALQIEPDNYNALSGKGWVFYCQGIEWSNLGSFENAVTAYNQAFGNRL